MYRREQFLLRAQVGAQDDAPAFGATADAVRQAGIADLGPAAPSKVVQGPEGLVDAVYAEARPNSAVHARVLGPAAMVATLFLRRINLIFVGLS